MLTSADEFGGGAGAGVASADGYGGGAGGGYGGGAGAGAAYGVTAGQGAYGGGAGAGAYGAGAADAQGGYGGATHDTIQIVYNFSKFSFEDFTIQAQLDHLVISSFEVGLHVARVVICHHTT